MPVSREELEEERQLILRNHQAIVDMQEQWTDPLRAWGMTARAPRSDESYDDFRRNMCAEQKKRLPVNHDLRRTKYWDLRADAFNVMEPMLMRAVAEAGHSPDSAPSGGMRMVEDPFTKIRTFIGKESFVKAMSHPVRRVVSFWTGEGPPMSASGRFLR
jgi:hypothetical protein